MPWALIYLLGGFSVKIEKIDEFETTKVERSVETTPKITLRNSKLEKSVAVVGGVLEAQYAADNYYLLFVTEGNPFEEALYIYFLDRNLIIKDSLELSIDYVSGIFRDFSIVKSNSIRFSFFDKKDNWILTVFDNPRMSFFGKKYPVKRKFSFFFKNWLQLEKS